MKTKPPGPCANGSHGDPDRYSPLVCVALVNGEATPLIDPVHVFPHNQSGGSTQIHWVAPKGNVLHLEYKDPAQGCMKPVNCNGENCVAPANPQATGGEQCQYRIWVDGQTKPTDPIIIIDSCCS